MLVAANCTKWFTGLRTSKDVIKWKKNPRYWLFVRGIRRPMDSHHKGKQRGALMFSLFCAWTTGWTNNQVIWDAIALIMTSLSRWVSVLGEVDPTPPVSSHGACQWSCQYVVTDQCNRIPKIIYFDSWRFPWRYKITQGYSLYWEDLWVSWRTS